MNRVHQRELHARSRLIRVPRLLHVFPRRFRHWLVDQLLDEPTLIHRLTMRCKWKVEQWNLGLPPDVALSSADLRKNPRRWGPPLLLDCGYNAVPDVGEDAIIAALTSSEAGLTLTGGQHYDNANARIGVGNDNTAFAEGQTDLIGTNVRKGMNASYPQDSGAQAVDFQSDFTSAEANFDWEEWGLFNHATTGQMLSRKVESLGTKASGSTWTLTATYDLSGV